MIAVPSGGAAGAVLVPVDAFGGPEASPERRVSDLYRRPGTITDSASPRAAEALGFLEQRLSRLDHALRLSGQSIASALLAWPPFPRRRRPGRTGRGVRICCWREVGYETLAALALAHMERQREIEATMSPYTYEVPYTEKKNGVESLAQYLKRAKIEGMSLAQYLKRAKIEGIPT